MAAFPVQMTNPDTGETLEVTSLAAYHEALWDGFLPGTPPPPAPRNQVAAHLSDVDEAVSVLAGDLADVDFDLAALRDATLPLVAQMVTTAAAAEAAKAAQDSGRLSDATLSANYGRGISLTNGLFAVSTASADNSAGIQAALDAAAGRSLYVPNGSYAHASTLNIPGRTRIQFESKDAAWRYTGSTTAVKISDKKNLDTYGLNIDLSAAGASAVGLHIAGLWLATFADFKVKCSTSLSSTQTAVLIETTTTGTTWGTYAVRFINPDLKEGYGSYGFLARKSVGDNVSVTHLAIEGGWVWGKTVGVRLENVNSSRLVGTCLERPAGGASTGNGLEIKSCESLFLSPGEIVGFPEYGIKFESGNGTIYLVGESRVSGGGTLGYMDTSIYTPTRYAREAVRLYGSNVDQTYNVQLESIFNFAKSMVLSANGGSVYGTKHELITWGDSSPLTIAQRRNAGVQVEVAGGKVGFYGAAPVAQKLQTDDLKATLVALGLISGTVGSTPLDLGGGTLKHGAVYRKRQTANANYTVSAFDSTVFATVAAITVTLPSASTSDQRVVTIKNTSTGAVTVAAAAGNVETGQTSIAASGFKTYQSDGATWWVIG